MGLSAKRFCLADAAEGALAGAIARRCAAAFAARGKEVLLLVAGGDARPARTSGELQRHREHLEGAFLRGYLATDEGYGALRLDAACDTPLLTILVEAYDLLLVAGELVRIAVAAPAPGIPALLLSTSFAEALGAADEALRTVRGEAAGVRPIAFALTENGTLLGERLARRWRLASWGSADDAVGLCDRIRDEADPVPLVKPAPKAKGADLPSHDAGTPCDDEEGECVRAILRELRADPAFRSAQRSPSLQVEEETRERLAAAVRAIVARRDDIPLDAERRERLVARVLDEATGAGPLEPLLTDPATSEVMVNGPDAVFVEREGRIHPTALRFVDEEHLRIVIDRLLTLVGRRVDEACPLADARLPDGSRVHAVLPPVAIDGPTLTIRRFLRRFERMEDLVLAGMMPAPIAAFLSEAVRARRTLLVSGGTGAGKTTLLGLLAEAVDTAERLVTIEDAAELALRAEHVVRLEARPPNIEGRGAVTIRDLVRAALRMRPDRIVVGECRGPEALDMLQAMNTGHEGSMTTVHANAPRDALARLETMVLTGSVELPLAAVRAQIARAIDLIVQVARGADGVRRVTAIAELVGLEGPIYTLRTLIERDAGGELVAVDPSLNAVDGD